MHTLVIFLTLFAIHISPDTRERELSQRLDESWRRQALYEVQVRALRTQLSELQRILDQSVADNLASLALAKQAGFGYWFLPFSLCSVREPSIARLDCYDAAVNYRQQQMGVEVTRPEN